MVHIHEELPQASSEALQSQVEDLDAGNSDVLTQQPDMATSETQVAEPITAVVAVPEAAPAPSSAPGESVRPPRVSRGRKIGAGIVAGLTLLGAGLGIGLSAGGDKDASPVAASGEAPKDKTDTPDSTTPEPTTTIPTTTPETTPTTQAPATPEGTISESDNPYATIDAVLAAAELPTADEALLRRLHTEFKYPATMILEYLPASYESRGFSIDESYKAAFSALVNDALAAVNAQSPEMNAARFGGKPVSGNFEVYAASQADHFFAPMMDDVQDYEVVNDDANSVTIKGIVRLVGFNKKFYDDKDFIPAPDSGTYAFTGGSRYMTVSFTVDKSTGYLKDYSVNTK